jgi:hypothetical protein
MDIAVLSDERYLHNVNVIIRQQLDSVEVDMFLIEHVVLWNVVSLQKKGIVIVADGIGMIQNVSVNATQINDVVVYSSMYHCHS